jgi:hypothetical protein
MASPLRVKNTAYFDIAATPPPTHLGILRRPLAEGYAPTTRPTSQRDRSAALPVRRTALGGRAPCGPGPGLAAKLRFGGVDDGPWGKHSDHRVGAWTFAGRRYATA